MVILTNEISIVYHMGHQNCCVWGY